MIAILLADGRPVVRQGVRAWLLDEADLKLVGEASDGVEACDLAERLQPDVVVLDVALPVLDGLEVMRQIHARSPRTRAVVFSDCASQFRVAQLLLAGAIAIVPREAGQAELLGAIRDAARSRRHLPRQFVDLAVDAYAAQGQPMASPLDELTDRERAILYLVVDGRTSAEIAKLLFLSKRTVEGHRASMMRKLGLKSPMDLLRFAFYWGILPSTEWPSPPRAPGHAR